ncbi:hypothetical protein [Aminobacter sp. MDW-2]|uniref:hypothetical protein n=1 Tax=Aminobacter sp. MDW-2 TaxID=2666139 RepID=UPI0012B00A6D|nr:hypothetical protein [Aminobacter sp. MDW-2]MRX33206.1 hypothetical protein [Aminobacter sp. MDW-2]QNH36829.1 hypothetical protein H5P29_13545 [Aminobacter sp. MDW-2]
MSEAVSLHVICRQEGSRPKGLVLVDRDTGAHDSYSWRVKDEQIAGLIGKTFCMHAAKSELSYLGGQIIEIRREPIEANDGEVRAIVRFQVTKDARGIAWPPTSNPNEYHQVNTEVPLDRLR